MKILVINPNTTSSMTEKIGAAARSVAARDTEIVALNPEGGPVSIEGYYDEVFAVPGLLEEIQRGEAEGFDGYVVACFDDTGLDAARTMTPRPVVGICEAAVRVASILCTRFSVVTTLRRSVPPLRDLTEKYGVARRCSVRAAEVTVLDLEDPGSSARERIRSEIARAIEEDEAEAIVLGCAGMADLARELGDEIGRPVIDGVCAAVKLVEAVVGLGLETSKSGGYAPPRAKEYVGELARFQPK